GQSLVGPRVIERKRELGDSLSAELFLEKSCMIERRVFEDFAHDRKAFFQPAHQYSEPDPLVDSEVEVTQHLSGQVSLLHDLLDGLGIHGEVEPTLALLEANLDHAFAVTGQE